MRRDIKPEFRNACFVSNESKGQETSRILRPYFLSFRNHTISIDLVGHSRHKQLVFGVNHLHHCFEVVPFRKMKGVTDEKQHNEPEDGVLSLMNYLNTGL